MDPRLTALALVFVACSSGSTTTDAGPDVPVAHGDGTVSADASGDTAAPTDTSTATTDAATDAMDATSPTSDVPTPGADGGACGAHDGYSVAPNSLTPGLVTATILDLDDAAVPGVYAILCGTNLCTAPANSQSNGSLALSTTFAMDNPALRYGDTIAYPQFAVPVRSAGASLGVLHTAPFPTMGQPLVAGMSVTSGSLTLTIPAGDTVAVDTLNYATPDEQLFRAVQIPIALAPVDPSLGLGIVIGTTPQETLFCPPVQASIPNTVGWLAGTAVDFYALGTDPSSFHAPYGSAAVLSTGHVSNDSLTIRTDPGQGLWVLTSLGIRRH